MNQVYEDFLIEFDFENKLNKWAKIYKNKKVVLYGCGLLFDKIVEKYDIASKLNIVAVCDVKYESNKPDSYAGFKTIKPSELSSFDFDVLIFTVFDHLTCLNYLNTFEFFDESKEYRYIKELSIISQFKHLALKSNIALKYLAHTKNIFKMFKYFFSCNFTEFNSKYNYLKVMDRLRKKKIGRAHV